jgi:hypothetical protein
VGLGLSLYFSIQCPRLAYLHQFQFSMDSTLHSVWLWPTLDLFSIPVTHEWEMRKSSAVGRLRNVIWAQHFLLCYGMMGNYNIMVHGYTFAMC